MNTKTIGLIAVCVAASTVGSLNFTAVRNQSGNVSARVW